MTNNAVINIALTDDGYKASATMSSYIATVNQERFLIATRALTNPPKDISANY